MAETDGEAAGQADSDQKEARPKVTVTAQYVKDFSFENPNAPQSLAWPKDGPQMTVNIHAEAVKLAPTDYEVVLRIGATATLAESTVFVVELVYAGLFSLQNIPEDKLDAVCLIECPRLIFPFARRIIADATRDGGFPPMLIEPVDFARLHRQRQRRKAQAQTSADNQQPEADS